MADVVDDKTEGKHDDTIDDVADKAKDIVDDLDDAQSKPGGQARRCGSPSTALRRPRVGACAEDEGSAEELCAAVAEDGRHHQRSRASTRPTPRPRSTQLRDARVTLGDLLDAAPEEVRDDLQVEIDYVQALIEVLEDVEPGDATESALQIQAVTDAHPGVDEAAAEPRRLRRRGVLTAPEPAASGSRRASPTRGR